MSSFRNHQIGGSHPILRHYEVMTVSAIMTDCSGHCVIVNGEDEDQFRTSYSSNDSRSWIIHRQLILLLVVNVGIELVIQRINAFTKEWLATPSSPITRLRVKQNQNWGLYND